MVKHTNINKFMIMNYLTKQFVRWKKNCLYLWWAWFVLMAVSLNATPVFVEAESFHQKGGWVVDQQFMDIMGSPYLLAHGLGKPVASARTDVRFSTSGVYEVFVRTRDWVAPHGPGQFAVIIDGQRLSTTFGIKTSGEWGWQSGGVITVSNTVVCVELVDLTGFEGRCDALLFVPENERSSYVLPTSTDFTWRRELLGLPSEAPVAGDYDFVVVGGGYAGICAAVAAARLGLQVALIQDRPVLGGNASGEVRVGPIGQVSFPPFERNADIIYEIYKLSWRGEAFAGLRPAPDDGALEHWVRKQPGLSLFLNHRVNAATQKGSRVVSVKARNIETSHELVFKGKFFADCTGDGTVGFMVGAEYRSGSESRAETDEALAPEEGGMKYMGTSNLWTTRWVQKEIAFPSCPWALPITEESLNCTSSDREVSKQRGEPYVVCWNWESGFFRDQIKDAEWIRDHNFRAAYGTWDYLKNKSTNRSYYAKAEMTWLAYVSGKRESRRLMGDYVLTEHDLTQNRVQADGCVMTTWYLDLHYPHPCNSKFFPGEEFRSIAYDDPQFDRLKGSIHGQYRSIKPYPIPFRCFYSKNIDNLFMAGRNISVTHVGLASVRVMNTTAMMGTMVGRATFLCKKNNCFPRDLYINHLEDLLNLLKNPGKQTELSIAGQRAFQGRETLVDEIKWQIRHHTGMPVRRVAVFLLGVLGVSIFAIYSRRMWKS